jgi:hypothetical protein
VKPLVHRKRAHRNQGLGPYQSERTFAIWRSILHGGIPPAGPDRVHNDSRMLPDSAEAVRPLASTMCGRRHGPGHVRSSPLAGRLDKFRGSGLAIVGSDSPTADAGRNPGGPRGILARPIHELAVDTPRPVGPAGAYRGRMPSAATAVQLYDEEGQ